MVLKIVLSLGVVIGAGLFVAVWNDILPPRPEKPIIAREWFGKGLRKEESKDVKPFVIKYSDNDLADLKLRIRGDLTRLKNVNVAPLEDVGFEYGFNADYLINDVASYWMTSFDWRKQEKMLNDVLPQFTTKMDGLDVHFAHIKPKNAKNKRVLPLLMVHGWPGSFVEFIKIVPMLTTPDPKRDFVFEVIAPSIPGYGFSSAPAKTGFNAGQTARIFVELMERLGHKKFYAQGGDWGSLVTGAMTTLYPESVIGLHLNMVSVNTPSANLKLMTAALFPNLVLDAKDYAKVVPLGEKFGYLMQESGYMHLQATKPDTVGIGLTASPVGLAAYILEKFSTWTNRGWRGEKDGKLTSKYSMDELLTNIMVYWINGNIIPSQRYYKENLATDLFMTLDRIPVESVPVGVAAFPEEIFAQPASFIKNKFQRLISYTDMPTGGHFAAFEEPKLLYDDLVQFVQKVEESLSSTSNSSSKKEL